MDEISADDQEKVKRALQQGHVDDEDFKGDVEVNRPGAKGYRTPQKKKTAKQAEKEVTYHEFSPPSSMN